MTLLWLPLAACQKAAPPSALTSAEPPHAEAAHAESEHAEPAWFQGDVPAAFEAARASGKPVFLYWGAVWCPPCKQIKATVFSRPDFIAKSQLFIPVYLDGDTAGAQRYGDEFQVTGYPTVVILRADRQEITRISGGMDLAQYANVLDTALAVARPASQLLFALHVAKSLSHDECRLLAYRGWGLDEEARERPELTAKQLHRAAELCPASQGPEHDRLVVLANVFSFAPVSAAVNELSPILSDPQRAASAADALTLLDTEFFAAAAKLPAPIPARLRAEWSAAMNAIAADAQFADPDQVDALAHKLRGLQALNLDAAAFKTEGDAALARTEAALAHKVTAYEHAGTVNSALHVYDVLERHERAYEVAKAELAVSKQPYYYMVELADQCEKMGRNEESLQWAERAYREAQGIATRFQWGYNYLSSLLKYAPDDAARVRAVGLQVIGELDGPDRIYRRTRIRLSKLDAQLRDWAEGAKSSATPAARHAVLTELRNGMRGVCTKIAVKDAAYASCAGFLAKI